MIRRIPKDINPAIRSWANLAAMATIDLAIPSIVGWVNDTDDQIVFTELKPGTDASDPANGIQRPDDYDAATNAVVWYKIGP